MKNLSVCTNIESLTPLEILHSAQDDNVECKHTLHVIRNVSLHHDILNVVKNLSVCTNIESLTPLEIFRFAQDDISTKKEYPKALFFYLCLAVITLIIDKPRAIFHRRWANQRFATSLPYQREVWRDCRYESSKLENLHTPISEYASTKKRVPKYSFSLCAY